MRAGIVALACVLALGLAACTGGGGGGGTQPDPGAGLSFEPTDTVIDSRYLESQPGSDGVGTSGSGSGTLVLRPSTDPGAGFDVDSTVY